MDTASIETIDILRHAADLRETWQARLLAGALYPGGDPRSALGAVILSVLAHNFDEAMPVLLRVVFPGHTSIRPPFLCTAGKITKGGQVCADIVRRSGRIAKMQAFFKNTKVMESVFRQVADGLKLSDDDRKQLFAAVQNWIVCDYRIDPAMDPRDPDAKRLVH